MTKEIRSDREKISRRIERGEERRRRCLLWQGGLWPVGGWRLKNPHPEPSMICEDLGINLRAFRSALRRLSDGFGGSGGRERDGGFLGTSTPDQSRLNHMRQNVTKGNGEENTTTEEARP